MSQKPKRGSREVVWIAASVGIGTAVGVAIENVAMGIAIGVAIGVPIAAISGAKTQSKSAKPIHNVLLRVWLALTIVAAVGALIIAK